MTAIVEYDPNNSNKIIAVHFATNVVPGQNINAQRTGTLFAEVHATKTSSLMGTDRIQKLLNNPSSNNLTAVAAASDGSNRPLISTYVPSTNGSPYARSITSYNTGIKTITNDGGSVTQVTKGIRPAAIRAAVVSGFANL